MNSECHDISCCQWPEKRRRVVTTGTFDGFHLGHREVVDMTLCIAAERDLEPLAITFSRHPLEIIAPERAPRLISSPSDNRKMLESAGVNVMTIPFDEQARHLTARDWLGLLKEKAGAEVVVMGYDNTLGRDGRSLAPADYQDIGKSLGIEIMTAPQLPGISSSAIRKMIKAGAVNAASAMLGRRFAFRGIVARGRQIGRTIGFPTANVDVNLRQILPRKGVYAAMVSLPDGSRLPASLNIGHDPSVATDAPLSVEAHIIGYSGNLYGSVIEVAPLYFLRDEKKFSSLEELKSAIAADIRLTEEIYCHLCPEA